MININTILIFASLFVASSANDYPLSFFEEKYITDTFNYISIDFELYPVNISSCNRLSTKQSSDVITTSELTITVNSTDCDPVFVTEYYSVKDGTAIAGLFSDTTKKQDTSKMCTLNIEVKCNSETEPVLIGNFTRVPEKASTHSENFTLIGNCISDLHLYIAYVNTNAEFEEDTATIHIGNKIDIKGIHPNMCATRTIN
ncbi:tnf receptor [Raccoonpox virus]|uniref:TNF alpha receptor-like protein n=1 Tax=Raccoon poxvirus TaxID=10256 RepID=A0A0G3FZV3_RACVI|nr:TNF alpha receptor-like protein [Raccoonpox virus]YP_009143511.1 TNF alpha receptor-like protein [Raccoonpox virus]AKJ93644.1 TNF alpha receptor-like protein [Raccoonpox virus]AKJ93832.1 TNF alpha receptor-like protein [Raccoonpox virus]AOP31468.1 tnf receptor [Raccoonpox virus]